MSRGQETERVERAEPRTPPRAGALHRPLPKWVTVPLAVVLALGVLLLVLNHDVLHVYRKHLLEDLPEARMPWNALSAGMNEAALHARFSGLALRCYPEPTDMGDRVCHAALRRVDGYPALTVALFLRRDRLTLATVHVPWWGHGRAMEALETAFGPGKAASDGGGTALRRWEIPGGRVDMNTRRRSLNPFAWSAVVWTPRS